MGVASVYFSTQASSNAFGLKPFFSYHPSLWLAPSSCRLGDRSGRLRRHYGLTERREVKSLQNSDEHCLSSYGPSGRVPNPWNTHLPVLPPKDVRRSAYQSIASHQPNSGPSPSFINQNKTIYPTYDHQKSSVQSPSKLAWERESYRQKVKRDQVCKNIAAGGVNSDSHQYDDLVNGYAASAHGRAIKKNPFEASFLVYRSGNSTDKDASRSLLAPKPGNQTGDTSNGSFKFPKNMLDGKVTANGVEVLSECSTANPELSVQTHGVNNGVKTPCWNSSGKPELLISTFGVDSILKESVRTETLNGKEHDLDVYGGRPNDDERFSECTSRIGILKKSSRKDSEAPLQRHTKLLHIYDKVLVVGDIPTAKNIVQMLTTKYKNLIHACDTEVAKIDVKQETPVDHGEVICFSIYSGPTADFGNGKSCIWVDLLDGDSDILTVFAPFFEDPSIKKVWHNYSFDCHVIRNHGIEVSGFHADTMHLARLWDSSRQINGGYSLEALTGDSVVMGKIKSEKSNGTVNASIVAQVNDDIDLTTGKISMRDIFGKKKLKKDGSEGKLVNIAPVEVLQREERIPWICYSALDSISTLKLFESLKNKLEKMEWFVEGKKMGNMYNFYEKYWQPFGNILVEMEAQGMLVNRTHLSEIEKVAVAEQKAAADKFRNWAVQYCPDAKCMNVGSDTQIRQLFFGGVANIKDPDNFLPEQKTFKVPNVDNVIEEGKKSPTKFRNITLTKIGGRMQTDIYTASGWPSVSGDALKNFAGQVSTSDSYLQDDEFLANNTEDVDEEALLEEGETAEPALNFDNTNDTSVYGTAYAAFGGGKKGRDACLAIAALCEICSIDSLISNFILPLQGDRISGKGGRIHCSLNINTETGRLSARRPNLQNPPALEKDRYKIREAFVAAPGNSLVVADYGQLELRILAHLANCKSMLDAFKAGGDFHSRTAMNMYDYIRNDVEDGKVLLEWHSKPGEDKPPVPLLKDAFASERRKAKMLNFSIAYGKTAIGLARDWKVPINEAKETLKRWYRGREEVLKWQEKQKEKALKEHRVHTLLGRARNFPRVISDNAQRGHIQRAAINAPVQGSAADVAMCAMLQIQRNNRLKELNWKLLLQVHDEVILEGPSESAEEAKAIVNECMSKPFDGHNFLRVDLVVDAKCAHSWYAAK